MKKELTKEQLAMAAEKRDRIRDIIKKISSMTAEERAVVASRLPLINTEGKQLSQHNAIMIAFQGGADCTIVGGFKQWLKQGRCVSAGQHGYSIWFPARGKDEDGEESADTKFLLGTVFDISQTIELSARAERQAA